MSPDWLGGICVDDRTICVAVPSAQELAAAGRSDRGRRPAVCICCAARHAPGHAALIGPAIAVPKQQLMGDRLHAQVWLSMATTDEGWDEMVQLMGADPVRLRLSSKSPRPQVPSFFCAPAAAAIASAKPGPGAPRGSSFGAALAGRKPPPRRFRTGMALFVTHLLWLLRCF